MASVSELPKKDSHVCLNEIECYLRHQNYPEHVQSKGDTVKLIFGERKRNLAYVMEYYLWH